MKFRTTRRRVLVWAAGIAPLLSGCKEEDTDSEGGEQKSQNKYRLLSDALLDVGAPWKHSAENIDQEMVNEIRGSMEALAEKAKSGGDIALLRAIIDATKDSFEIAYERQQELQIANMRTKATETEVGNPGIVEENYITLDLNFDPNQPYYPLFGVLSRDFSALGNDKSSQNIRQVQQDADAINQLFMIGYQSAISDFDKNEGDPLVESLKFLRETSNMASNL